MFLKHAPGKSFDGLRAFRHSRTFELFVCVSCNKTLENIWEILQRQLDVEMTNGNEAKNKIESVGNLRDQFMGKLVYAILSSRAVHNGFPLISASHVPFSCNNVAQSPLCVVIS